MTLRYVAAGVVAVGALATGTACAAQTPHATPVAKTAVAPVVSTQLPTSEPGVATGPFGSELNNWQDAQTTLGITVSQPYQADGEWRVNVTEVVHQGSNVNPDDFEAQTDAGTQLKEAHDLESYDHPGQLDTSDGLQQGQTLTGYVAFDVPAGQHIAKVYALDSEVAVAVWR